MRYREWADKARDAAPENLIQNPLRVELVAFLPIPGSWPKKKRQEMAGQFHRQKPDSDNLMKCIDALWDQDCGIAIGSVRKFWDDGKGPRIEVTVSIVP
jgi:Holliday junction resolvase RusA-like endonuclease